MHRSAICFFASFLSACGGSPTVDTDAETPCVDTDGDGHRAASCGGDDCNDGDPDVRPGATETCNWRDDDCSGTVDDIDPSLCAAAPGEVATCNGDGTCSVTCGSDFVDCTAELGCETPSDTNNCGTCGRVCFHPVCEAGICVRDFVAIETGGYHGCGLRDSGIVECWGSNYYGQVGIGVAGDSFARGEVVGLTDAVKIALGGSSSCAVRADATVVCWGSNTGNDTTPSSSTPVPVIGLANIVDVAIGNAFACALRQGGDVFCWGDNQFGQLGNGTMARSATTPVRVETLTDAAQVTAGSDHACARREDGTVACWGYNVEGQLGDGTNASHSLPTTVSSLDAVLGVAAGGHHSCARRMDHTVWCWGSNSSGELGDGTTNGSRVPVQADTGLSNPVEIDLGGDYSCARGALGIVHCWGGNGAGQLGDGSRSESHVGVAVVGLDDAASVSAGQGFTCALRRVGQAVCWGANGLGQLGDGTMSDQTVRVPVLDP